VASDICELKKSEKKSLILVGGMMEYYCDLRIRKFLVLILVTLLLGSIIGCETDSSFSDMEAEHQRLTGVIRHQLGDSRTGLLGASAAESTAYPRVLLKPGDEIELKFYYTPELDVTQVVRPDGKIALQLIGEISVQGKTPAELREELLKLYLPHLKKPEISVILRSLQNRRVYVGGQVMTPGVIEMPAEIDVLEAIMEVGGFLLPEAEVKSVIVIRHREDQRYAYSINLENALKGETSQPFYLQPQDIVYVPRTKITMLNQWVDQHINKLIPETGFFFSRRSGRTTIGYGYD
jgi:protein involved in polysaccharide export with SLBB domain